MILSNLIKLIKSFPPGSALYGRAGESAENLETCILIRENEDQILKIPANPVIELRSGIWPNHVYPVIVMIKLATFLYETWWNYYQPQGKGEKYFDDMIRQTMIPILVYDHRQQRRSIGIHNSLASSFKKCREAILRKSPWSMKDFDAAKQKLCDQYPSVATLWEALDADITQA
ncbi:MAG: hypothetical protein AUJ72_04955 [Candidatus Omnitrophica bacterium CG1_02_46_14]|nr:MAG: hypothetical protein AUJ72_04955 [Candidatus Omnitrophica bacterium CG1_02_46_14]